jgi:hypothetical protein
MTTAPEPVPRVLYQATADAGSSLHNSEGEKQNLVSGVTKYMPASVRIVLAVDSYNYTEHLLSKTTKESASWTQV